MCMILEGKQSSKYDTHIIVLTYTIYKQRIILSNFNKIIQCNILLFLPREGGGGQWAFYYTSFESFKF